ncbi:hypothetical protein AAHC03_020886 [Spirometra sp. Aus1]
MDHWTPAAEAPVWRGVDHLPLLLLLPSLRARACAHNRSPRAVAINASPRPAATIAHGCVVVVAAAAALSMRRHSVVPWLRPSALYLRTCFLYPPRSLAALRALWQPRALTHTCERSDDLEPHSRTARGCTGAPAAMRARARA